jgi:microcystin-dependent protein
MPEPPSTRIIPLERQTPLTHAQVEQVRFGLSDTGPLAQAVMNANVSAVMKQLTIGAVSCLSARKPADPVVGQMIWETDTQQVRFWNGTAWVTPANATPSGAISAFGGVSLPAGYLWCDGSQQLIASYPALFSALGVSRYGVDTATQFYLPNLTSHLPRGAATTGGAVATNNNNTFTLNNTSTFAVSPAVDGAHNHSVNAGNTIGVGGHSHTNPNASNAASTGNNNVASGTATLRPNAGHNHAISVTVDATGSGHNHTINSTNTSSTGDHSHSVNAATITGTGNYVPAFVEVNYIIKT